MGDLQKRFGLYRSSSDASQTVLVREAYLDCIWTVRLAQKPENSTLFCGALGESETFVINRDPEAC